MSVIVQSFALQRILLLYLCAENHTILQSRPPVVDNFSDCSAEYGSVFYIRAPDLIHWRKVGVSVTGACHELVCSPM